MKPDDFDGDGFEREMESHKHSLSNPIVLNGLAHLFLSQIGHP